MSAQRTLRSIVAIALVVNEVAALNDTTANGDEFSNNLFSDLAPLLTLFGEQVWCSLYITVFRVNSLLSNSTAHNL
jgi:hypothetical protein